VIVQRALLLRIEGGLMAPMEITAAHHQRRLHPDDLGARQELHGAQRLVHLRTMQAAMPDIADHVGEQCPGLAPVCPIVVFYFSAREAFAADARLSRQLGS
jgi:hypothetical protein